MMEMMKTTTMVRRRQKRQRHDSDRDSDNGVGGGGSGKSDDDYDVVHAKPLRQMEGMVTARVEGEPTMTDQTATRRILLSCPKR